MLVTRRVPGAPSRCSTRDSGTRRAARLLPGRVGQPGAARNVLLLHLRPAAAGRGGGDGPLYLSDLIAFETEEEDGSGSSSSGSSSAAGSRDAAGAAAGVAPAGGDGDPTQRAQEIINRATEVLAAARAALASPEAPQRPAAAGTAGAPPAQQQAAAASRQRSGGGGGTATVAPPAPGKPPASAAKAAAPAAAPRGPGGSSGSGGSSSGGSSGEPLTRRWSGLSDDQDLTRHVLQSALDRMQRSGAPIAAPKDDDDGGGSAGDLPRSSGDGGGGGAAAAEAAAAGGGVRRANRDIRHGSGSGAAAADASGHGPAPRWAASLLGSDDFGGDGPQGGGGGGGGPGGGGGGGGPSSSFFPAFPAELQLRPQAAPAAGAGGPALAFADDDDDAPRRGGGAPPAALGLLSQAQLDAQRARGAVLPPLQSVVELTTAFRPPERTGGQPAPAPAPAAVADSEGDVVAAAAAAPVGRALADGRGTLADGTWYEKRSGIEYGKNGYWKKWQTLRGGNAEGTLEWEETWWEASDYTGLKEMGAEKRGNNAEGDAWREAWQERLMYASGALDCVVERSAHKWAAEANGDEWEEKWGEHYHASGKVAKHADKWGKNGPNVWHERWGEDYDAAVGDAVVKWTDKWAERLLPGGAREQWGDKWHESFAGGRGEKNGEVWSVAADGGRYQRWWGEQHYGDRRVRRHGHSTGGEQWDDVVTMDTYYNPVPHFGFKLALAHSPQLLGLPLRPKAVDKEDPFGPGLDAL